MDTPQPIMPQSTVIVAESVTIGIARKQGSTEDFLMIGPITLMLPINDAVKKAIVEGLTKVQIVAATELPKQ